MLNFDEKMALLTALPNVLSAWLRYCPDGRLTLPCSLSAFRVFDKGGAGRHRLDNGVEHPGVRSARPAGQCCEAVTLVLVHAGFVHD